MRKGIIFLLFIIISTLGTNVPEVSSKDLNITEMIPDEAIRLRILANSDREADQQIKYVIRDEVTAYISERVKHIDEIEEGRRVIAGSVPELEKIAKQTLEKHGVNQNVRVEYGDNVIFPQKVYGQLMYPAGEYEAILITVGEGKGENWWCVLFPPLCFVDFSNGETEEANTEDEHEKDDADDELAEKEEKNEHAEEPTSDRDEEVEIKFFIFDWLRLS